MATKEQRQAGIIRLVRSGPVETQQDLLCALRRQRLNVDQSTLSRDLAELGVRKVRGRYMAVDDEAPRQTEIDYRAAVVRFVTCGPHLIVVFTGMGQAQAVALAIDGKEDSSITGTVAGDDTILVAVKSRRSQAVALRRLAQWFGDKYGR